MSRVRWLGSKKEVECDKCTSYVDEKDAIQLSFSRHLCKACMPKPIETELTADELLLIEGALRITRNMMSVQREYSSTHSAMCTTYEISQLFKKIGTICDDIRTINKETKETGPSC